MKTFKKVMGIVLTLAFIASMGVIPAMAEQKYEQVDPPITGNELVDVAGTTFTFKKFLVIGAGDKVPNVTFNYTIEAGGPLSVDTGENTIFQVNEGIMTGLNTNTSVPATTFGPNDTTYDAVRTDSNTNEVIDFDVSREAAHRQTGLTAARGVQFEATKGEKYAVKESTIDFSNVRFPEPGIYRYIIRETASNENAARGIMHDNHTFRVLDVYVTDKEGSDEGKLQISGYVLHKGWDKGTGTEGTWKENPEVTIDDNNPGNMGSRDVQNQGGRLGDKTDGFTNEYKSYDLVFKKEVTGNQASRDKYFLMQLNITNLTEGDKYVVSLASDGNDNTTDGNADATTGNNEATRASNRGQTNVVELEADSNGEINKAFYLQHGQYIAVLGLPANARYTVTEDKEDYKQDAAAVDDHKNAVTGLMSEQDAKLRTNGTGADDNPDHVVYTSYKNTRDGIIPTGLIKVLAPAVGVIVLAVVGLGIVMASKRREEEEAE